MGKCDRLKEILSQDLQTMQPHARMPSRNYLCRKYTLSRATVDKALKALTHDGLLYAIRGSGTFVSARTEMPSGGVMSWGVVVPNIMDDICPVFLRGIEDYAQKLSVNIVICNTDNDPEKEAEYLRRLANSGVQGLIVIPTIHGTGNAAPFRQLESRRISFVFCNRTMDAMDHIPFVASNDFFGGYIATKHLIAVGYRHIGFVSRHRYRTSMNRFYGYTAALLEAGLFIDRAIVVAELKQDDDAYMQQRVAAMLRAEQPPDAFFCHNDAVAQRICRALTQNGKQISDDVGVIGYDNTSLCESMATKLSSVAFKNYEMGSKAAEILNDLIGGKQLVGFNTFVFQPELVLRGSCLGPRTIKA